MKQIWIKCFGAFHVDPETGEEYVVGESRMYSRQYWTCCTTHQSTCAGVYTRSTLFEFVLVCAAKAGLNKDVTANYEEAGHAAAREVKRAELASALAAVSQSF